MEHMDRVGTLPGLLLHIMKDRFGLEVRGAKEIRSYYGGVFEVAIDLDRGYVVKVFKALDEKGKQRHAAAVAFSDYVGQNVSEFTTQRFVRNRDGGTLQPIGGDDYFYVVEKQEIVTRKELAEEEQRGLGVLMKVFHTHLKDFKHPGIGDSSWISSFDDQDLALLRRDYRESEYVRYTQPLDHAASGLDSTLLHGDWHAGNMSFTSPPFLYDLDTLCFGSPAEEIARSVTHWDTRAPKRAFMENIVAGYASLTPKEVELIPRLMVTICYKKYCEFMHNNDRGNAEGYRALAGYLKREFDLS